VYDLAQAQQVWPMPARFRRCLPGDWAEHGRIDYEQQWQEARSWVAGFRRYLVNSPDTALVGHGLVLVGPTGTGKTMLACSFMNYLTAKGFSAAFTRDGDLMRLLTNRYPSDEELDLLAYLQRSALVIVDDLGRTAGATDTIEPFLRYRMDEGKPTIITMNNVPLSDTLRSLLHEFTYIVFEGEDRRVSPLEPDHAGW
jgi:DNA replication protein DnaC